MRVKLLLHPALRLGVLALTLGLFSACTGYVERPSDDLAGVSADPGVAETSVVPQACALGLSACAQACAELSSDAAHCGACDHACSSQELCDQGTCRPRAEGCSSGLSLCGASCVDHQQSSSHCGGCGTACAALQACSGGACACPDGGQLCQGICVDVAASDVHCGACDNPCTAGRSCVGGGCVCPDSQLFCDEACVDVVMNEEHCGECGVVCDAGRNCVDGACECEGELLFCGSSCVDVQVSNEHCGGCLLPCEGGQSCDGGSCVCPAGQTFCAESCVDTLTTDAHCGGCDKACALGKACVAGQCTGGGGTGEDGCSGLAKNITVSQVAVYQSLKIPIMQGGSEVAPAARISDVITGRETLVRVFVTLGAGFTAHEVSARLILEQGDTTTSYYQKKTISKTSDDADSSSTFQLYVPKEQILEQTRLYVELVDCVSTTGSLQTPRYPGGDADVALGARDVGGLKVKFIPITCNARTADTSAASLDVYENHLQAMFPVAGVEVSVGDTLSTSYPVDWNGVLDQVRAKRQTDAPASDVYYYGLLKCADTFQAFCNGSCTTGIGYITSSGQASRRAAVGIGFADGYSSGTMAHELGHNHGRYHAPCVSGGTISDVDESYPHDGGLAGVWGYDNRSKVLISPNATDIMGYCSNKWISDYTYDALVNRVASVNGVADMYFSAALLSTWRVLLLDSKGPRWGIPSTQPELPSGVPELAEVLDAQGLVQEEITVYRTEISDIDAASVQVPEPEPGWHAVRLSGLPPLAFSAAVVVPAP